MNDANQKKNAPRTEPCGTPQVSEPMCMLILRKSSQISMRKTAASQTGHEEGEDSVFIISMSFSVIRDSEVNDSTRRMSRPSLDQIGLYVPCDLKPV